MIKLNQLQPVFLGNQGENLARTLEFDVSVWLGKWPEAEIRMLVQRPSENTPYIVDTADISDGVLRWTPDAADTAIAGTGKIMFRIMRGAQLMKSAVCSTYIAKSLDAPTAAPDPAQGWVDQVIDAADQAEENAKRAGEYADEAGLFAEKAQEAAENAQKSAEAFADDLPRIEARLPPEEGTVGDVLTKTADGSEWKKAGGTLPVRDGETGTEFLARIDAYDLLTDAEGDYIADVEGEPLFGAVYNPAPDVLVLAKKAETAAQVAQKVADEANAAANNAQNTATTAQSTANAARNAANAAQSTASAAQTKANSAATKNNPVFTGSFSQNRKSGTTVGSYSHAEGSLSTASGNSSHAEGGSTKATAASSHAEGYNTTASGNYSHAENNTTTASKIGSHAEGYNTQASSDYQHVQGKYNVIDTEGKYAHIVGNGSSSARSNAHTLDWYGNAYYAGSVECDGIIMTSIDGEKKYLITIDESGSLIAQQLLDE